MPVFVSGVVTLADGLTPVAKRNVTAVPVGSRSTADWRVGTTDADGAFVLNAPLRPGDYALSVNEGTNEVPVQMITVTANSGPFGVRLALPGGSLSGCVTDPRGNPVGGAMVLVHNVATKANAVVRTDANGLYTLDHLPAGTYDVNAISDSTGGPGKFAGAKAMGVAVGTDPRTQDLRLVNAKH